MTVIADPGRIKTKPCAQCKKPRAVAFRQRFPRDKRPDVSRGTDRTPLSFGRTMLCRAVDKRQPGWRQAPSSRNERRWSQTTPVRIGDILFASSVSFGSLGIKLEERRGVSPPVKPAAAQIWKEPSLTCYFGTPIAFDGLLYVVTGQADSPGTHDK